MKTESVFFVRIVTPPLTYAPGIHITNVHKQENFNRILNKIIQKGRKNCVYILLFHKFLRKIFDFVLKGGWRGQINILKPS